jgi:hypothetical protein
VSGAHTRTLFVRSSHDTGRAVSDHLVWPDLALGYPRASTADVRRSLDVCSGAAPLGLGSNCPCTDPDGMDKVLATMLAHLSLNITLAVGGASLASVVFWQTLAGEYVLAILAVVALSARPPNVPAIVPVAGKPHDSTAT